MADLTINGIKHTIDAPPEMPLLWAIRDLVGLTGTKYGCGAGLCLACTVMIDGEPMQSCGLDVAFAEGKAITTIEGGSGKVFEAVQAAWRKLDVVQCGYCQSGQIMRATALLTEKPAPSDDEIDAAMNGNICRCGTYQRIRAAIHDAAKALA